MKPLADIQLTGDIPAKKNLWKRGARGGMYISADTKKQLDDFLYQLKKFRPARPIESPCEVKMEIFTRTMRADGDGIMTTIFDLLQKAGVIKNDRWIVDFSVRRRKADKSVAFIEIFPVRL